MILFPIGVLAGVFLVIAVFTWDLFGVRTMIEEDIRAVGDDSDAWPYLQTLSRTPETISYRGETGDDDVWNYYQRPKWREDDDA